MSVTLAAMRDEAKLALGSRDDMTDSLINGFLNASQLAMATRLRIFEVEVAVTFVLAPTQTDPDLYGVPLDFWSPIIMVNRDLNRKEIKLKPISRITASPSTPAGRVEEYGLRAKTLIFRPAPSTADTLEWLYKKRVATMTDLVNLTLPDEFAPAVVFDALVRAMHLTGEEDRAQIFRDHRNDILSGIGDQRGEEFGQREEGVIIAGMDPAVRLA